MTRGPISILLCLTFTWLACGADGRKDDFERERKEGDTLKDSLEGKPAPPLQVEGWVNTDGKPLTLANLKGKVVVLDFWGVWCGPCLAAMPHLKELYEKHKAEGLVVVSIHTSGRGDEMAKYVEENALPWPIAVDLDDQTVKAYYVDSYPDYYVIDRSGNVRIADLANKELDRAVESLLKEK
jgi:thiol-disulfide isomerase/thioredoxin